MARFATTDPSLSSVAADRRQGLSLIAPQMPRGEELSRKSLLR
jgi:hypothetical protein